jgi:heme/copper-type cytochrome/quinol oxidase subunit 2
MKTTLASNPKRDYKLASDHDHEGSRKPPTHHNNEIRKTWTIYPIGASQIGQIYSYWFSNLLRKLWNYSGFWNNLHQIRSATKDWKVK